MATRHRHALRVTALLFTLCMALAAAAPLAYATTPQQEAEQLTTDQRSLQNPGGSFTVPEPRTDLRLLHPQTRQAASLIISNTIDQFRSGTADPEAVQRILAYAPIVTEEELPTHGEWTTSTLQYLLENGIRNVYIVLRETDQAGVYQILTIYTTRAGKIFWVPQGIEYEPATGIIHGTDDSGILGIGYDYNVSDYLARTAPNTWQRIFGFNRLYDLGTPLLLTFIDTLRFPFVYEGHDWMVQVWKGNYGPSNGGEIGLYEKPTARPFFWDASNTKLDMSMQVWHENGLLFDYGTQHTWWVGGFQYNNPLLIRSAKKLRLAGSITFEEEGMRDAFWQSFEQNKNSLITGELDGMMFSFDWAMG